MPAIVSGSGSGEHPNYVLGSNAAVGTPPWCQRSALRASAPITACR